MLSLIDAVNPLMIKLEVVAPLSNGNAATAIQVDARKERVELDESIDICAESIGPRFSHQTVIALLAHVQGRKRTILCNVGPSQTSRLQRTARTNLRPATARRQFASIEEQMVALQVELPPSTRLD